MGRQYAFMNAKSSEEAKEETDDGEDTISHSEGLAILDKIGDDHGYVGGLFRHGLLRGMSAKCMALDFSQREETGYHDYYCSSKINN